MAFSCIEQNNNYAPGWGDIVKTTDNLMTRQTIASGSTLTWCRLSELWWRWLKLRSLVSQSGIILPFRLAILCHHSSAVVTPFNYEGDIDKQPVSVTSKLWKKGMTEIGLAYSNPMTITVVIESRATSQFTRMINEITVKSQGWEMLVLNIWVHGKPFIDIVVPLFPKIGDDHMVKWSLAIGT